MSKDRAAVYDVPKFHEVLYKEQHTKTTDKVAGEGDKKVAGFGERLMPEVFHKLYAANPDKIENPGRGAVARARIHELIDQLPEFETLRKQTVRDAMWAGMATDALCESVQKTLPVLEVVPDADEAEAVLAGMKHLAETDEIFGSHVEGAQAAADAAAQAAQDQANGMNETDIRNGLRQGINNAAQQIDDAEAACTALNYGSGAGGGGTRNPNVAMALARKVASSPTLKEIIAIAGRLTQTARSKRASRTVYARNELVGVEPTGNLARILPSELGNLATKMGTAVLYRKLVEKSALGYAVHGNEKVGKGPIVLCIDQSGSMSGNKDIWAKGIALALLDAARSEKRAFGIILYDDGVAQHKLFPDPDKTDPMDILTLLASFSGGGTDFRAPIELALSWVGAAGETNKFKKADIVHITDGGASTEGAEQAMQKAKDLGCAIYGIAIGHDSYGSSLSAWSTEKVTQISDVSKDTAAVDTIFDNIG